MKTKHPKMNPAERAAVAAYSLCGREEFIRDANLEAINEAIDHCNRSVNTSPLWFACVDFPNACPDDCPSLIKTSDSFSTYGSPTQYECECNEALECPIYDAHEKKMHELDDFVAVINCGLT